MKKDTQMKIIDGAINGVIKALFGRLNDGVNFDLLENYKTENFYNGTEEFLKEKAQDSVWQIGYANVDLTPKDYKEKNYYLGGYISPDNKFKNLIENVVDDMQGRAIAVSDNSGRGISLFCTVDCIGITNGDIREIRAMFSKEFAERYPDKKLASVNVCSTHTHSCVDTEGLWTDFPGKILRNRKKNLKKQTDLEQGTDKEYMNFLRKSVSDTFFKAIESMCDGELYFAQKDIGEDYFSNKNRPSATGLVTDITRLRFVPFDKTKKPTLIVNFPAHPDVAGLPTSDKNGTGRELSGDYVHYMGETINKAGYNFMFFNGAICAIYSNRDKALDGHTFEHRYEQSIRYGIEVGRIALSLTKNLDEIKNDIVLYDEEEIKKDTEKSKLNGAEYSLWCENWEPVEEVKVEPLFNIRLKEVNVPVTNKLMVAVGKLNIANYKMLKGGEHGYSMFSEVGYIEMGKNIKIAMVPGEFCCDLLTGGASLKAEGAVTKTDFNYPTIREILGENTIAFGLSNDEIGYIVPDNDFTMGDPGNHYHELVSLGQYVGSSVIKGFLEIKEELQ
ncbi:MAG: hypothetical protein IKC01_01365 [Clostridia bacterium]|nr:hypothetical protein [Clostridia bacterium]